MVLVFFSEVDLGWFFLVIEYPLEVKWQKFFHIKCKRISDFQMNIFCQFKFCHIRINGFKVSLHCQSSCVGAYLNWCNIGCRISGSLVYLLCWYFKPEGLKFEKTHTRCYPYHICLCFFWWNAQKTEFSMTSFKPHNTNLNQRKWVAA